MSNKSKGPILFFSGLILGGAISYFVTKKVVSVKFELDLQEQIQDVKEHYKLLRKTEEYASLDTIKNTTDIYKEIIESYEPKNVIELAQWEQDLLSQANDEIVETEVRDTDRPYIISVEEFMGDEPDYDKTTVTYFEEDDVLCDEREVVISDVEANVGVDSLTKFGKLSGDENIVYVRNENIQSDFEVILDKRSYSEVVLGFKEEKGVLKMREDD